MSNENIYDVQDAVQLIGDTGKVTLWYVSKDQSTCKTAAKKRDQSAWG